MHELRVGIDALLEEVEKRKGTPFLVKAEFPTGYGKTQSGPLVYRDLRDDGWVANALHILPLKALVHNLVGKFIKNIINEEKKGMEHVRAGLSIDEIAYQMGDYLEEVEIDGTKIQVEKRPLFDARYIFTTMDSYIHNLFRVPVTEMFKFKRHYFIPLGRIFTALVIYDEAHMFLNREDRIPSIMIEALQANYYMRNPVLIFTATLPEAYERYLLEEVGKKFKVVTVRLGKDKETRDNLRVVEDKGFEDLMRGVKWNTSVITYDEVVNKAKIHAESGDRVLVVIDGVREAMEIYTKLRDLSKVGLIHGGLTRMDRMKVMGSLKDLRILVGTSAIEAGLDESFDVLITTALNPSSLVQRVGRICREGAGKDRENSCKGRGDIYVVKGFRGEESNLINEIEKHRGDEICWRLPYRVDNCKITYVDIINNFSDKEYRTYQGKMNSENNYLFRLTLKHILSLMAPPQELIDKVMRENNFSFTRTLLEVYTRGKDSFLSSHSEDREIGPYSLVMDLWEIVTWWNRLENCIECVGYLEDLGRPNRNEKISENRKRITNCSEKMLENLKKIMGNHGSKNWAVYRKLNRYYMQFVVELQSTPILVLKKDCYVPGEGIKPVILS